MKIIPQLTDSGKGLLIAALSGNTLNFTRLKIGSGLRPSGADDSWRDRLTDLVHPMINVNFSEFNKGTNYVELVSKFDNSSVTANFNWTETGIFATDIDGNEVLYAYCYTDEQYETIPANNMGKTVAITLQIPIMVGEAEDVTAAIAQSMIYVTKEDFEEHKRDFKNPHGVNAEQIGLGNVENVAPNNMVIAYSMADKLEEPTSGEKIYIAFGKIKKAIHSFILHLKANNPHAITPAKIGAADYAHSHSAADITSGTLPVSRGGTGVSSLADLTNLLGQGIKMPVFGFFTGNGSVKRLISLEFTPSALILTDGRGRMFDGAGGTCGGICVGTHGVRSINSTELSHETTWNDTNTAILITNNGFWVNFNSSSQIATNAADETYRYIAFK